jgi:hypothetical protein
MPPITPKITTPPQGPPVNAASTANNVPALQGRPGRQYRPGHLSRLPAVRRRRPGLVPVLWPSRAAVIAASDRLGIPSERLMDSAWLGPHHRSPEGTQK